MRTITLEKGLATFVNALSGKNRSAATIRAYSTDIAQFIAFLYANNGDRLTEPNSGLTLLTGYPMSANYTKCLL